MPQVAALPDYLRGTIFVVPTKERATLSHVTSRLLVIAMLITVGCKRPTGTPAPRRSATTAPQVTTAPTTNPTDSELARTRSTELSTLLAVDNQIPVIAMFDDSEWGSRPYFVAYASGRVIYCDALFDATTRSRDSYLTNTSSDSINKLATKLTNALVTSGYNRTWFGYLHYTRQLTVVHSKQAYGLGAVEPRGDSVKYRSNMSDAAKNWELMRGMIIEHFDREDLSKGATIIDDLQLKKFILVKLIEGSEGIQPNRKW